MQLRHVPIYLCIDILLFFKYTENDILIAEKWENFMKEQNGTMKNQAGKQIYTKTWLPDQTPKANIILVHGIGEYCERYGHVAEFLTGIGCAVYGFDHPGHGKSEGKRGCMRYADAFEIINTLKGDLTKKYPEIPLIIYGHSMGGGVVLAYGTKYPEQVKGIIATSPAVGMANPLKPGFVRMMRILGKLTPDLTISNGLPADGISHDKAVVEKYQDDPLVHDKVSVALGLDLYDWGNAVAARTEPYPVPLLVAQGSEDRLVDPVAAENFALHAKGNVTYKRFEGGYHELHNEPNKQELFDAMAQWIDKVIN